MPVSIGIPFYNAERFLASAIRSVFAQSISEWELLLVDDGSTDSSLDIAQSVRDPRVRVMSDGRNMKLAYRLNQISAESSHEYVARMDADDLMAPMRLEKQRAVLDSNPEIQLVSAGICSITDDGEPIGVRCGTGNPQVTGRHLLLGRCGIAHAAIVGRKSWLIRNPYDVSLSLAQDYELWLRTFSRRDLNVHVVNEPLYYYRETGNVQARKLLKAYKQQRALMREYGCAVSSGLSKFEAICQSLAKTAVAGCLAAAKRTDLLLARRNQRLDQADAERIRLDIERINRTPVPGLD